MRSIFVYIISSVMHAFWLVLTHDLLEDRRIDDVINKTFFVILYYIKQIDSKLPCACPVIDHRGRQNVVRTSVTHSAEPRVPLFCPFVHFGVICDLSLNRRTATWNLFVNFISVHRYQNSCAYQGRERPPSVCCKFTWKDSQRASLVYI